MNSKVLFCFLALLALSYSSKYTLYSFFNENQPQKDWDLSDWEVKGKLAPDSIEDALQTCGNESILGGYDKFGKTVKLKTKNKLPINYPHKSVWISFDLFAIDSWDPNLDNKYAEHLDRVILKVDGKKEYTITKDWNVCDRPVELCGLKGTQFYLKEFVYHIEIEVPHTVEDGGIDINFKTIFDEKANNESWGIQNLEIAVDFYCDDCGCKCPDGYFSDGNTCSKCFYKCKRCVDWHTCLECEQDFTNGFERVKPNCWCEYEAEDVNGVCTEPKQCKYGYSGVKKAHEDKYECVKCPDNCAECTKWGTCIECKGANRPSWNCNTCNWGYEENKYGYCVKC